MSVGTIFVGLFLIGIIVLAARKVIRDHKSHKCNCNCSGCDNDSCSCYKK